MGIEKKMIKWTCTAKPDWQWMSFVEPRPGFPVHQDGVREGTILLPPNHEFWWCCAELVLQGVTTGSACFRYFEEDGKQRIQAWTNAKGKWDSKPAPSEKVSETTDTGGINLRVEILL
ncbi:MAG: hypothetical protein ACLQKA_18580 [Bryobacteraceae bacterium]